MLIKRSITFIMVSWSLIFQLIITFPLGFKRITNSRIFSTTSKCFACLPVIHWLNNNNYILYSIRYYIETGCLSRQVKKTKKYMERLTSSIHQEKTIEKRSLNMIDVAFPFQILVVGMLSSLAFFIVENHFYIMKNCSKKIFSI